MNHIKTVEFSEKELNQFRAFLFTTITKEDSPILLTILRQEANNNADIQKDLIAFYHQNSDLHLSDSSKVYLTIHHVRIRQQLRQMKKALTISNDPTAPMTILSE